MNESQKLRVEKKNVMQNGLFIFNITEPFSVTWTKSKAWRKLATILNMLLFSEREGVMGRMARWFHCTALGAAKGFEIDENRLTSNWNMWKLVFHHNWSLMRDINCRQAETHMIGCRRWWEIQWNMDFNIVRFEGNSKWTECGRCCRRRHQRSAPSRSCQSMETKLFIKIMLIRSSWISRAWIIILWCSFSIIMIIIIDRRPHTHTIMHAERTYPPAPPLPHPSPCGHRAPMPVIMATTRGRVEHDVLWAPTIPIN